MTRFALLLAFAMLPGLALAQGQPPQQQQATPDEVIAALGAKAMGLQQLLDTAYVQKARDDAAARKAAADAEAQKATLMDWLKQAQAQVKP